MKKPLSRPGDSTCFLHVVLDIGGKLKMVTFKAKDFKSAMSVEKMSLALTRAREEFLKDSQARGGPSLSPIVDSKGQNLVH